MADMEYEKLRARNMQMNAAALNRIFCGESVYFDEIEAPQIMGTGRTQRVRMPKRHFDEKVKGTPETKTLSKYF